MARLEDRLSKLIHLGAEMRSVIRRLRALNPKEKTTP